MLKHFILWAALSASGLTAAAQTVVPPVEQVGAVAAHPFFRSADLPAWSALTPQQAVADAEYAAQLALERIAAICRLSPEEATIDNTYLAVDEASDELQCVVMLAQHLLYAADTPENRAACEKVSDIMSDLTAEIYSNEKLWQLMQAAGTQEKVAVLSPAKKRAVKQLYDIFVDNGANLSAEKKVQRNALEKEMMQLSMQFEKHLQDFTQNWELLIKSKEELEGVPEPVMLDLRAAAAEKGLDGWLLTLRDETAPHVMAMCTVESTRKKCWEAVFGYGAGSEYDTAPIIAQLMEKRQAFAELLGFKNYADYEARTRMVHSGDEALAFVDDMICKLKPAYDKEVAAQLKAFEEFCNKPVSALNPWDELFASYVYYNEAQLGSGVDLSPYLKCNQVINGMFAVYSKLLGVTYKQVPAVCLKPGQTCPQGKVEVWHPSVKCIAVYDTATNVHFGTFYLDLYRRDNKRTGAWCAPLRLAEPGPGGAVQEPHIAALMANFEPPEKGVPNLLSHAELVVLFHEFGHMMHHLLSHTELKGHCAMGVAWDFTEFPSTLAENWAWSPEVLAVFARHYRTKQACPEQYLKALSEDRKAMQVSMYMEILRKAKLDLEIHMHYAQKFKGRSLDEVSAAIAKDCQLPYASTPYSCLRSLSHCFSGGYAAGVYTYLWSEVMAADAFTLFERSGLMNPQIGKKYRETILEKGDSIPADVLYRMFMGRDPDADALMRRHKLQHNL
ncbi:MAG: M3 family metallopeptidase [Akkermansia sp.]|nr:M3 family metallopeptidase [Akkermansia sp.]